MAVGVLLGVCSLIFMPNSSSVRASSRCTVTFNYNISQIDKYLPDNTDLRQSLSTYSVEVDENNLAVETNKPLSSLSTYYTYEWFTASGEKINLSERQFFQGTILYARWTPVNYTIYYSYETTAEMAQITNLMQSEIYNIETPKLYLYKPNRPHYVFMGWYCKNDPRERISIDTGSTGDLVVFARWRPLEYLISYNTDADNTRNPISYNIEDDEYVLASPTKKGHIFQGWYLDRECTQEITSIPAGTTGNISIYPKWDLVKYEVVYIIPDNTRQSIIVEYGETVPLPEIETSIFEIVLTNKSRKNISEDTTIEIRVVNIWYVYVIALVLLVSIITLVIVLKKRRDRILSRLRVMYQSNSNKKY